jgi:hypothetical protein
MFALALQVIALVGLPVGGFLGNAGIVCTSVSVGFIGLAIERGNA